jgi:hypothetical protein
MVGQLVGVVIGIVAILIGAKGFTSAGLPLNKRRNITGVPGKLIGICCIAFGVLALGFIGAVQLVLLGVLPPIKDWF